jgi:hypothetical protein
MSSNNLGRRETTGELVDRGPKRMASHTLISANTYAPPAAFRKDEARSSGREFA